MGACRRIVKSGRAEGCAQRPPSRTLAFSSGRTLPGTGAKSVHVRVTSRDVSIRYTEYRCVPPPVGIRGGWAPSSRVGPASGEETRELRDRKDAGAAEHQHANVVVAREDRGLDDPSSGNFVEVRHARPTRMRPVPLEVVTRRIEMRTRQRPRERRAAAPIPDRRVRHRPGAPRDNTREDRSPR